jgi:hypothetical protein
MIGLKTYLPDLVPFLGQTREMLYERQRALVRCGALYAEPGRGPGSGVKADAESLAIFLISILSHDLLVHSPITQAFSWMKSESGKCPITGAKTFKEAIEKVLSNERLADKVGSIIVNRNQQTAIIEFLGPLLKDHGIVTSRKISRSSFANKGLLQHPGLTSELWVTISLRSKTIQKIAKDIASFRKADKK